MPCNYVSHIEERHAVGQSAGIFDVSHMTVVDISGEGARGYLRYLLANDVARIDGMVGKALYSGMLNETGGVIDDLIVYNMGGDAKDQQWYRTVVNCGTREKDLAWMQEQAKRFFVEVTERADLAMVAVQGPRAIELHKQVADAELIEKIDQLTVFQGVEWGNSLYARTGYTGEDGLEIIVPSEEVEALWVSLINVGVKPCGLGARDTLRLEAGMNLYGNEMDDSVSPLVANMAWTIAWQPDDREFVGRQVLEAEKRSGCTHKLVGLVMRDKGVLRAHQRVLVLDEQGVEQYGEITSGTFSPTLGYSIALARIPHVPSAKAGQSCEVEIRKKRVTVEIVKPSFVRNGAALI